MEDRMSPTIVRAINSQFFKYNNYRYNFHFIISFYGNWKFIIKIKSVQIDVQRFLQEIFSENHRIENKMYKITYIKIEIYYHFLCKLLRKLSV